MSLCELKLYREFEQKVLENYQNKMFMGIVENKYYTPSIEDIRVGYEYESLQKQQDGSEKWVPQKIVRRYDLEGDWENWLYYGIVKTPYLTKEQIEAEGWKIENVLIQDDDDNDMFSTGFVKDIDENHWYELFFQGDKIFIQYKWYRNSVTQLCRTVYYGKCPSINEFRTIQKLLGIEKENKKKTN